MPVPGLSLLGPERIRGLISILRYINPTIIIIIIKICGKTKVIYANKLKLCLLQVAESEEDGERLVERTRESSFELMAISLVEEEIEDAGFEEHGWLNLCPTMAS